MIFNLENYSSQNHNCTLQTIISLENFISTHSGFYSKTQLWEKLPKKMMYQSYKVVFEYLESQQKISLTNKKVIWNSSFKQFDLAQFEAQHHLPTLQTILLVENFFHNHSNTYSKTQAWGKLPKKMMYQTYKVVLAFLEYSKSIRFERKRVISTYFDLLTKKYDIKQSPILVYEENRKLTGSINNNKGDLNSSIPPPRSSRIRNRKRGGQQ